MDPALIAEIEDVRDDIALNEGLLESLIEDGDDSETEESRRALQSNIKKLRKRLRALQPAVTNDGDEPLKELDATLNAPAAEGEPSFNRGDYLMPPPKYDSVSRKRQRGDFDLSDDLGAPSSKSRRTTPSSAVSAAPSPADSTDSLGSLDDPFIDSLFGSYSKEEIQQNRDYWKIHEQRKEQEKRDAELAKSLSEDWSQDDTPFLAQQSVGQPSEYTQAFFKTDGSINRRAPSQIAGSSSMGAGPAVKRELPFNPHPTLSSNHELPTYAHSTPSLNQEPSTYGTSTPHFKTEHHSATSPWAPGISSLSSGSRMPIKQEPSLGSMPGAFPSSFYGSMGGASVYGSTGPNNFPTPFPSLPGGLLDDPLLYPGYAAYPGYGYHDPAKTQEELKDLLKHIRPDEEITAGQMPQQPEGLKVNLMPHQLAGLAWMKRMEEGTNKGGILADDMGLGKTIQSISLILERPPPENKRCPTLVVAPVALMHQWKREIEKMVRSRHRLNVFVLHGESRKSTWASLKAYDVILTTYGLLASELKRKLAWEEKLKLVPDARPSISEECPILGERSKFHRVILDEAQNIKNRTSKAGLAACRIHAVHRWALTGTPMQNNVEEMFSLIKFCRIRPYNEWTQFRRDISGPLKSRSGNKDKSMATLQALLRAILLRRTKTSKIHGQPILQLPPKETREERVAFDKDQMEFYQGLETNAQIQFNKYLRRGSLGRNYSHALVLLLRLRQACCHPSLVVQSKDFLQVAGELDGDTLATNAAQLDAKVVERLKQAESSECPICMDVDENPALFPCGHSLCNDCLSRLVDQATNDNNGRPNCPHCRAEIDANKITDMASFLRVHCPNREGVQPLDQEEDDSDSDSDSDDSCDDSDDGGDLDGFIVPDDFEESSESEKKKQKPAKKSKNGKRKARSKETVTTLAQLRKEGLRNKAAKRRYLKRLRKTFHTSAKIKKTVELLEEIKSRGENEKTIIFSNFTSFLDLLEVPLSQHKDFSQYVRYDGSMSPTERNDAVLEFTENPSCNVILVSLKAGNSGLNLTVANRVIMLDPFWNPFVEYQAADRCYRIGQLREVTVHRVLIGEEDAENKPERPEGFTVEDRILRLQEEKRQLVETALDETASHNVSRLGERELGYLFGLNSL